MNRKTSELVRKLLNQPSYVFLRALIQFRLVYSFVYRLFRIRGKVFNKKSSNKDGRFLWCIYDLDACPISYNSVEYFASYNYEAKKRKKKFIVVFVKQRFLKKISGSFNDAYNHDNRNYRLHNLLMPAATMFPAFAGTVILEYPSQIKEIASNVEIFPTNYSIFDIESSQVDCFEYENVGLEFAAITIQDFVISLAQKIICNKHNKKIITITLRRSKYDPARNSALKEWAKFINYLQEKDFLVIVLPDIENPEDVRPIAEDLIRQELAFNLELRAATYQLSYLNVGVANGPLILSHMNKFSNTIIVKIAPDGAEIGVEQYRKVNKDPNATSFWADDNKNIFSTLDDNFKNLVYIFERFLAK